MFTSKSHLHLQLVCYSRSTVWINSEVFAAIDCWESTSYCLYWKRATCNNPDWGDKAWGESHRRSSSICISQFDRRLNCTFTSCGSHRHAHACMHTHTHTQELRWLLIIQYSVVITPQRVKLSSFSLSRFHRRPSPHFSARLHKHIQCTDTSTRADTGTSVPRLQCPTQASFIPWSGKQLEHRRCSTWVGSEGPFGEYFFVLFSLCWFINISKTRREWSAVRLHFRQSYVELRSSSDPATNKQKRENRNVKNSA